MKRLVPALLAAFCAAFSTVAAGAQQQTFSTLQAGHPAPQPAAPNAPAVVPELYLNLYPNHPHHPPVPPRPPTPRPPPCTAGHCPRPPVPPVVPKPPPGVRPAVPVVVPKPPVAPPR
jgi:hypothetical protein